MNCSQQAQVTAIGGRVGVVASNDRRLRLQLSAPEATSGADGQGTNPEQLFAAAYAASFLSAIKAAAAQEDVRILADSNVTATVSLRPTDPEMPDQLEIRLNADLPGVAAHTAEQLIARALSRCPYSRAIRDHIDVHISAP